MSAAGPGAFPGAAQILSRLVGFETVNGEERPAAEWVGELLASLGMRVEIQGVAERRANVFARIGRGDALLLSGHLDVVPALGAWSTPPFELVRKGGVYFGRGACDMKGAIAAMIGAMRAFLASGEALRREFQLLFVADEEKDNLGTRLFLQNPRPGIRCAVIGEPTELRVAIAHKGVARFKVAVRGRSVHSSIARQGVNALTGAALLIQALRDQDEALEAVGHPVLTPPTINATMLRGGEQDNIIPGEAHLIVDYRLHPGVSYEEALATMRSVADAVAGKHPAFGFAVSRHCYLPGGEIAAEHPWVASCLGAAERCFGGEARPVEFRGGCEQSLMMGAGIPTVILGPGSLDQAHAVDEFLTEAQLAGAEALYGELIRSFNRE